MTTAPTSAVALRFGFGLGTGLLAGLLAFRNAVFDPGEPAFHCLTTGALTAGSLALLRSDRLVHAVGLAGAAVLLRLGFVQSQGWTVVIAGSLLIAGVFLVSLIFDLLARHGIRFGKFLVLGPLLGGIFLAVTPLAEFERIGGSDLWTELMRHVFLGVLIGDAVGLGAEVADLFVEKLRGPA